MERKLDVSNASWGAWGWQLSCPPVNKALPGLVTWKDVAASLLPLTLPYSPPFSQPPFFSALQVFPALIPVCLPPPGPTRYV